MNRNPLIKTDDRERKAPSRNQLIVAVQRITSKLWPQTTLRPLLSQTQEGIEKRVLSRDPPLRSFFSLLLGRALPGVIPINSLSGIGRLTPAYHDLATLVSEKKMHLLTPRHHMMAGPSAILLGQSYEIPIGPPGHKILRTRLSASRALTGWRVFLSLSESTPRSQDPRTNIPLYYKGQFFCSSVAIAKERM